MPVTVDVPQDVVKATVSQARKGVMNKNNLHVFDRAEMPWLTFLEKTKKEVAFTRGVDIQLLKRNGGGDLQLFTRGEVLDFDETFIDDQMEWDGFRCHRGVQIFHTDMEDRGFNVIPNDGGSRTRVQKIPRAAAEQLYDYFSEQMEDMKNTYNERLNEILLRKGDQDDLAPAGLDGLLPLDNTVGTIATKDRSDGIFRHAVITGSTTGAGGTIERDLNKGVRLAQTFTRGFKSAIDTIFAGDKWIDAYVDYAKANGLRYKADAGEATGVDIGIPDNGIRWNGLRVMRNPTFTEMDANGFVGQGETEWAKRAYFLNSKTWQLGHGKGKDRFFRQPVDPSDQLISRFSLFGRYSLRCMFPRGQFVNTIA